MGRYRRVFALLALSCLAYTCQITSIHAAELDGGQLPDVSQSEPAPEPPGVEDIPPADAPDQSGGEVVVEDEKNVYHIEADTIIIQPVSGDADDPVDSSTENDSLGTEDDLLPGEEASSESPLDGEALPEEIFSLDSLALDPDGFLYYGSSWARGHTTDGEEIVLYFPITYQSGFLGTDSSGELFNVSDESWSGVVHVVGTDQVYTATFSSWKLPTYRIYNGSSYRTVTLHFIFEEGNILLPDGPSPIYSIPDLLPYVGVLLLGGVFICCMKRS